MTPRVITIIQTPPDGLTDGEVKEVALRKARELCAEGYGEPEVVVGQLADLGPEDGAEGSPA